MPSRTPPFAGFEWMIAWRYLRARRDEGGVSVMTVISLLGVALAVFALIATLAVRAGFRAEFVGSIVGIDAHVSITSSESLTPGGRLTRVISDYDEMAARIAAVPGVTNAVPLVRGQVMASREGRAGAADIYGITFEDLNTIPRVVQPLAARGEIEDFAEGIAIGSALARELGVTVGDRIRLTSPDGAQTAMGTAFRVSAYDIVYVFTSGRYEVDRTRIYMPFDEAQRYFNRDGVADEIEVMVENPEGVERLVMPILRASGERAMAFTWRDRHQGFLQALDIEDNVMFVILSILVLIASMNIISGLIMLVKNKGRDIGILRTMGLSEASVMRIFFICGASIGLAGTVIGVVMGCLFALYMDPIFATLNQLMSGRIWSPEVRQIYFLPAELRLVDVLKAVGLSLFLSFVVTIFPARRAARMNPVEALRYE